MRNRTDNVARRESVRDVGPRKRDLLALLCLGCLVASGCDKSAAGPASRGLPPAAASNAAPEGPALHHAAAFDLVGTSEGAVLVWAAGPCGEGISVQRYTAEGAVAGVVTRLDGCGPVSDPKSEIVQLDAVANGGKLALAWVVLAGDAGHVLGSFGADTASAFAPVTRLGDAATGPARGRSRLALASSDSGQVRVAFRSTAAPCTGGPGQCARVMTTGHPPSPHAAERGTDTREVPDPCPELLVGADWNQGVWYEGFCALDGAEARPITQVYAIRPEIFYAEALPVLAGCAPLGLAKAEKGVLVFGTCEDGLHVQRLSESHLDVVTSAVREVRCESGRPWLEIRNGQGKTFVYRLDAPQDRLELWLPPRMASAGSRAAFTGRALLVTSVVDNALRLRSWKCQGETLVSDGPSMLYNAAPRVP